MKLFKKNNKDNNLEQDVIEEISNEKNQDVIEEVNKEENQDVIKDGSEEKSLKKYNKLKFSERISIRNEKKNVCK